MGFELVGVRLVAENAAGFNSAMAGADKAVLGFGQTADKTFGRMPGLSQIAIGALRHVGTIAVDAFMQAGKAAVDFFGDSISAAGDFESGMNRFAAVAGGALEESGLQLKDFRDQFIQIGKELPVSTAAVQDAAIEMVKGGIEPATIAAGGLKQIIQFAAAADLDLEKASTIAAKALGGWTDMAATAQEKAEFLAHSTDLLSKAANASTVNVDDLALGLYNVQGTAKLAGVSFDETVTALAELAPSFASSADAGTSFKSFLGSLQPKTKPAIAAMKALGLVTEEGNSVFYDAQGQFIGMSNASGILHDATKDLTEAQRVQLLQTIFGQDGIRVAAVLAEQGADGYNNMTTALEKQNSVADMAKQKQAGFNTAMDNFKGSVEALQITIGSYLLPVLTDLFNNYLAPGINILTDLADALFGNQEAFDRLSPTVQGVASFISGLMSGSSGLGDIWTNTLLPAATAIGTYFSTTIAPILSDLGTALFPLLGAAAQIAAGYWNDILWPALQLVGDVLATFVVPIIADVAKWLAENLPPAIQATADFLTGTLFPAIGDVYKFLDANLVPILADVRDWLDKNVPPAIAATAKFLNTTLFPALEQVWKFIQANVIPIITTLVNITFKAAETEIKILAGFWNTTLLPAIKDVWSFLDKNVIPLFRAVANVEIALVKLAVRELTRAWNEDLYPAIKTVYNWLNDNIIPIFKTTSDKGSELASFLRTTLGPAFAWLNDNVIAPVVTSFNNMIKGIQDLIGWLNDLADKINNLPGLPGGGDGGGASFIGGIGGGGGGKSFSPAASPMAILARSSGTGSAVYNQQRTANITYHTQYAPQVHSSLAIANALAGN